MDQFINRQKQICREQYPLVSVLMAVYNKDNTNELKESISSILKQSLSDFELIICNDGSPQRIEDYLIKYSEADPRIVVISNDKNCGSAVSRNRCLQISKGRYIAIMDSDDISEPDRLKKQISYLELNPNVDFVGCHGLIFHDYPGDCDKTYWFISNPKPKDFLMTLPFVHGSLVFRREALSAIGGYSEDRKVFRSEDYNLLMRMYQAGYTGANIKDSVYYIRETKNTFRRRKYRYRINETYVKLIGYKALKLWPIGILYAIKPLFVGLIPGRLLARIKKYYYMKKG